MNIQDQIIEEILATRNYTMYNGWGNARTEFGYHSFDLPNVSIKGQRTPSKRLEEFKKHVSFNDKVVVDIGCNVGGMLHHLPEIKQGYGFDYDDKCIVAANNISKILNQDKAEFYQFDFDQRSHEDVLKIIKQKIDVVFLLSVGKWISSHKELYKFFIEQGADIILELNNNRKDQSQLDVFKEAGLKPKLIISGSPDDNTEDNKNHRATYFIKNVRSSKT